MKAKVSITLKQGILDPQGQAVQHALISLGYTGAEAQVKAMCERLLANTIIEEYRIELLE